MLPLLIVEVLVNIKLFPFTHCAELLMVKEGIGFGKTVTAAKVESIQLLLLVTISFTRYMPLEAYVFVGLVLVEVLPSPNLHR